MLFSAVVEVFANGRCDLLVGGATFVVEHRHLASLEYGSTETFSGFLPFDGKGASYMVFLCQGVAPTPKPRWLLPEIKNLSFDKTTPSRIILKDTHFL
ncbi:MAG: hypothetical protein ACI97B_003536 [Verrucomicrobiales bacterium]